MTIFQEFTFEASHRLPNVSAEHKCARLHGHSFRVEIQVSGPLDPHLGWIIDYAEIVEAFRPVEEQIDHRYLNEIEGLENPTSENLARWLWRKLSPDLPLMTQIAVRETCMHGCIYTGDLEHP